MELDDFKTAWQALDQRLARDHALHTRLHRERRLDKARAGLRPLFWGQLLQMLFGLAFIGLAASLWMTGPTDWPTIAAGVAVHAYGVACIVMAGVVLGGLGRLDYAAPVLEIQKQLARVRKTYVLSGMVAGLPWWFLWVLVLMVLVGLEGGNLYAGAATFVWTGLGIGMAGLAGTAWFHRWTRSGQRPRLAQAMNDAVTGHSLRQAQAQLEEVLRFEQA
ncbi:MAG: hypothetical protein KA387_01145 [Rubrivivax sp.]|nr:hypothetical protein [Rubrivivax sp.]